MCSVCISLRYWLCQCVLPWRPETDVGWVGSLIACTLGFQTVFLLNTEITGWPGSPQGPLALPPSTRIFAVWWHIQLFMCSLRIQTWVFKLGQQALHPFIHLLGAIRPCLELFLFKTSFNIWSLVCVESRHCLKTTLYFTGLLVFLFLWIGCFPFVVCDKNTSRGNLKKGGFVWAHSLTTQLIMAKKVFNSSEVTFYLLLGGRGGWTLALSLLLSSLLSLGTNP